jgi:iron complex transport system ATP-binding protein
MITLQNCGYTVKGKPLLNNVSLAFCPNEISMIIGPNGAGKSTLIHLLSRHHGCTTGNIKLNGTDFSQFTLNELAKIRAVLAQSTHLAFPLTVKEVVMMGRYPHFKEKPSKEDDEICRQTMAFFKVDELLNRNYLTLSGGEKQRVHFARVTAQIWPDGNPATKVLLLDEPLTHLDMYYQYELLNLLKRLMKKQRMIIVGVIHDLNLAYKYADKVSLLNQGRLLAHGTINEVLTKEHIQTVFRVEPSVLITPQGEQVLWF